MDMDMGMDMDSPFANLSLSDPACVQAAEKCMAFMAAETASQEAVPWLTQFRYGRYVTYYWIAILGLASIWHFAQRIKDRRLTRGSGSTSSNRPGALKKLQAAMRLISYRRFTQPRGSLGLPTYGYSVLIFITFVFLLGLTVGQRPYYREHLGYGSPPVAIRTGLMAFACVPILVALAGKVNFITCLTGISHEKLNVLHRYVAWFSFVLSLVHTIPFLKQSATDPGWGGAPRVKHEFYVYGKMGGTEYSGVPALAILFALCVLSIPQVRARAYETFYGLHILLAITYLGLLFWHAGNLGDSWAYLWATLAVWASSWLARAFWKTQPLHLKGSWFQASSATVTVLADDVTKIEVWPPAGFTWTAGQHAFLRFMKISPLDNHPFTIASIPATPLDGSKEAGYETAPLLFFARSHAGFTRKLLSHATSSIKTAGGTIDNVWIDGPYGGVSRPIDRLYQNVILVAGGTGITACLPWLLHLVQQARAQGPAHLTKRVTLVWTVKHADALSWIQEYITKLGIDEIPNFAFSFSFHVTEASSTANTASLPPKTTAAVVTEKADHDVISSGDKSAASSISSTTAGGNKFSAGTFAHPTPATGRPNLPSIVQTWVQPGERSLIIGCGPEGFNIELANAAAAAQRRVLSGECIEIGLHVETFGW